MSADKPTIVVEVRGPQRSGVTSLAQLVTLWLRNYMARGHVVGPLLVDKSGADCLQALFTAGTRVEVREAEPDDRDRELGSLRQERDRLKQDVERLSRRQIPTSWSSPDGTEWSGLSGDGVLDVRGSKADIDVVVSWRQAKDRLAWFEEEYKKSQGREYTLKLQVEQLEEKLKSVSRLRDVATEAHLALKARYDRLLTAFHDATRRPLGVTPDSGLEFYDARMADEAEARRSRYGRGPK